MTLATRFINEREGIYYFINTRMGEMTKDVGSVIAGHGDFGCHHLDKGGEGREYSKLVGVETKTDSRRETTALHDARCNKDLGMLLVYGFQTSGPFQVTCTAMRYGKHTYSEKHTVDDHDLVGSFLLAEPVENEVDGFAKVVRLAPVSLVEPI